MSWKTVKLGDIFEVARGGSPRPIESFLTNDENGVNWIMIGDTKDGGKYIEKTLKKIKREGVVNSRMVYEGDFLLTNSMSFGRPYILKTSGCIHDGWLVLSPKNENIHRDYFYYYLGSDIIKQKLSSKAAGAVVKNLNKEIVAELEVELPPLATQKRIAEILDAADALRRKDQELLKKYDELAQAIFIDMFGDPVKNEKGWEVKKIKELLFLGEKISYGIVQPGDEQQNGVPVIRVGDFKMLGISKNNIKMVAHSVEQKHKKTRLFGDEVLIACVGSIGKIALADESLKGYNIVRATARVRLDQNRVNRKYLAVLLSQPSIQDYFISETRTVSQPTLNIKQIEETSILLPPIELQNKFEEMYNHIYKAVAKLLIDKSNRAFEALIQKAFKGELV